MNKIIKINDLAQFVKSKMWHNKKIILEISSIPNQEEFIELKISDNSSWKPKVNFDEGLNRCFKINQK